MRATLLIVCLLLCAFGCEQQATQNDLQPDTPGTGANVIAQVFETHNATEDELQLSMSEVAKRISATGNWKPVSLSEKGVGRYEATATTKDGREYPLEVRQTKDGIFWRWSNDDDSSGGSAMITW